MAKELLAASKVAAVVKAKTKKPAMHHDGGGLYLQVARSGSVSWIFRFRSPVTGKPRDMGLGIAHLDKDGKGDGPLKRARAHASAARELVADGKDPIEERKKAGKSGLTFRQAFVVMEKREPHRGWRAMFDIHAKPIADKRIDDITTSDIAEIIAGLLNTGRHETARKLQQRIQAVLRSAKGSIDTPAHKTYLTHSVRSFKRLRKNRPHPSLDVDKVPAFMRELRTYPEVAARALEFVILTACRTGDVIGVRDRRTKPKPSMIWDDIDFGRKVWTVPAIKTADDQDPEPFEVPLSDAAIDVLRRVEAMKLGCDIVFPCEWRTGRHRQPMAETAMRVLLKQMRPGITVHGFRITFRTWAGESTVPVFERDVIETALAHKVFSSDKAEGTYKSKTTFFDKRRTMMQRYGEFASKIVVALKKTA